MVGLLLPAGWAPCPANPAVLTAGPSGPHLQAPGSRNREGIQRSQASGLGGSCHLGKGLCLLFATELPPTPQFFCQVLTNAPAPPRPQARYSLSPDASQLHPVLLVSTAIISARVGEQPPLPSAAAPWPPQPLLHTAATLMSLKHEPDHIPSLLKAFHWLLVHGERSPKSSPRSARPGPSALALLSPRLFTSPTCCGSCIRPQSVPTCQAWTSDQSLSFLLQLLMGRGAVTSLRMKI